MKACRDCKHQVSEQAYMCPNCGAMHPAKPKWDGWGYEYKTKATFLGLPLVHISFKYRMNKMPVVARGVISIGQFGVGIINVSQFGVGLISISQFTLAGYAIVQFAIAYSCIAQIALYVDQGYGQVVRKLSAVLGGF